MITRPDEPHRENRAFRIALVASLVAHVVFAALAIATDDLARRAFHVSAARQPRKPPDEVVTISSALRLEKRARPVPVRPKAATPLERAASAPRKRAARAATAAKSVARVSIPQHDVTPRQARPPVPEPAPKPPTDDVRKPELPRPPALQRELATLNRRAPAQPSPVPAKPAPTSALPAKPAHAAQSKRSSEKQLASLDETVTPARPSAARQAASAQTRLSTERLAQIQRDLAKTIAETRSETNPLRTVPRETPVAPKRYRLQMQGAFHTLRRGEGYYYPVKSWRANGLDYYFVSYEFTWPNGTYETGNVPWPIHFSPAADPFASADPALVNRTPLPAPPPDYVPPGTLGKALRAYFPKLVFSDGDS